MMRPCDGTSGLVRGNRRKAVFAFKRAVSEGNLSVFASGQWVFAANFGSAGKIETCRAHSVFLPTKPQVARVQNRGLVGRPHFFTALPSSPVDNMRQPLESPSTTAFPHKVSAGRSIAAFRSARHARDLPHTSKFWALYPLLQMLQTLD